MWSAKIIQMRTKCSCVSVIITSGQRIWTKGRIAGGGGPDFSRRQRNMTPISREHCSRLQQSVWVLNDPFAAYTAAEIPNAFRWAGRPSKLAFTVRDLNTHLIDDSLDPRESARNGISICSAAFVQHRQTDHNRCYISSNRPHNNNNNNNAKDNDDNYDEITLYRPT